jgi:hypothetical protein
MNWTALRKTLTPSLNGLGLFLLVGLITFLFVAVLVGLVFGISHLLTYLFGKVVARWILGLCGLAFYGYILIIEPLIDRYERIKYDLERQNNR